VRVTLVDMKPGESGVVTGIEGGSNRTARIQGMGIRVGKRIKKEGAHLWRGPQTILVDKFKVAIGFGMASKIMVEVERDENK